MMQREGGGFDSYFLHFFKNKTIMGISEDVFDDSSHRSRKGQSQTFRAAVRLANERLDLTSPWFFKDASSILHFEVFDTRYSDWWVSPASVEARSADWSTLTGYLLC